MRITGSIKRIVRVIGFALIWSLVFGMMSTFAVSKPGKPQIKSVSANYNLVTVKWSKVKNASGYDLYRNGKKIKRTTSRSNKNSVYSNGKYTYKVRAYKKYNVEQNQYYNTETEQWQTTKIEGAETRTVNVVKYKYGQYSKTKSITINAITVDNSSFRADMLSRINKEREKAGVNPLVMDSRLNETAQIKAEDLYKTGVFSHESKNLGYVSDQLDSIGYTYSWCGENIAQGQRSVSQVMSDWMSSTGHRENILRAEFTVIGIGYYNGEWVQQFARPL